MADSTKFGSLCERATFVIVKGPERGCLIGKQVYRKTSGFPRKDESGNACNAVKLDQEGRTGEAVLIDENKEVLPVRR